jgi:hypothetical protein
VGPLATLEYPRPGYLEKLTDTVRLLEPIGYITPAEFEKAYYDGYEDLAVGAGLKCKDLRQTQGDSLTRTSMSYRPKYERTAFLNLRPRSNS